MAFEFAIAAIGVGVAVNFFEAGTAELGAPKPDIVLDEDEVEDPANGVDLGAPNEVCVVFGPEVLEFDGAPKVNEGLLEQKED